MKKPKTSNQNQHIYINNKRQTCCYQKKTYTMRAQNISVYFQRIRSHTPFTVRQRFLLCSITSIKITYLLLDIRILQRLMDRRIFFHGNLDEKILTTNNKNLRRKSVWSDYLLREPIELNFKKLLDKFFQKCGLSDPIVPKLQIIHRF